MLDAKVRAPWEEQGRSQTQRIIEPDLLNFTFHIAMEGVPTRERRERKAQFHFRYVSGAVYSSGILICGYEVIWEVRLVFFGCCLRLSSRSWPHSAARSSFTSRPRIGQTRPCKLTERLPWTAPVGNVRTDIVRHRGELAARGAPAPALPAEDEPRVRDVAPRHGRGPRLHRLPAGPQYALPLPHCTAQNSGAFCSDFVTAENSHREFTTGRWSASGLVCTRLPR